MPAAPVFCQHARAPEDEQVPPHPSTNQGERIYHRSIKGEEQRWNRVRPPGTIGSMDTNREQLLHDTATLYSRAARVLDPVRLQAWESMGVTFPQLRILFRVRVRPGIDVRGLANGLGISPSAASQQVDKLVARDFLNRREDPDDRRHVRLELTELGRQATGEISRASRSRVESVLTALSDGELADLHRLFGRLLSAVSVSDAPQSSVTA
jgi:DNA-binding MarR family transcriptional regulator